MKKLTKFGLVPRLIIAITLGILIGEFAPGVVVQSFVTVASLFSTFLKFIIPLMIIALITVGIADLSKGAGKLLGITTLLSYGSTLVASILALSVALTVFPIFIHHDVTTAFNNPDEMLLEPFIRLPLNPILDVMQALVLAFSLGICISILRIGKTAHYDEQRDAAMMTEEEGLKILGQNSKNQQAWQEKLHGGTGEFIFHVFSEFSQCINLILEKFIIPFLPLYILGTFANIAYSGSTFEVLSVFLKVFIVIIILHIVYITFLFVIAGVVGKKNPLVLLKNQLPGYLTAIGTQSSAATIPVNLQCAKKNGVSEGIRDFVIPLCATIHLAGSIISITSCVTATLMMHEMDYSLAKMLPLLITLGFVMVAAPGAPGGAIMAALPFLSMVGIPADGAIASLLIAVYITQDSFGTAANVSGDNALAVIVDTIYEKWIKRDGAVSQPESA
jgi:Na+/H+-dicarboxylate symporter